MQQLTSIAVVVVAASLLAAAAAAATLTCRTHHGGTCEAANECFVYNDKGFGYKDTTFGCLSLDSTYCRDHSVHPNSCTKHETFWGYDRYCCCSARLQGSLCEYLIKQTSPPSTPPASTTTTTGSSSAPSVACREKVALWARAECLSRICYRLFGSGGVEPFDYGCADRADDGDGPPAALLVAMCSGKTHYSFYSTDRRGMDVLVSCCHDSAPFCNGERAPAVRAVGAPNAATAAHPTLLLSLATAAALVPLF